MKLIAINLEIQNNLLSKKLKVVKSFLHFPITRWRIEALGNLTMEHNQKKRKIGSFKDLEN